MIEVVSSRDAQFEELLELPIAPAPREGTPQTWTRSDVIQHLELRGMHSSAFRWLGSERTQLRRGKPAEKPDMISAELTSAIRPTQVNPGKGQSPAFIQERAVKQAEMLLRQAITEYVALKSGDRTGWRITVVVPPAHAALMQVKSNIVTIGGGIEPWEGEQEFQIEVKDRGALVQIPVRATLELPPMIVTATRPLRREEVITADALTYSPLPERSTANAENYFTDIDKVIGKQLRRSLATGQPLESQFVGDPIVVTRGDLVEVESVAGSIVVRTTGRAAESGAVGDLIGIELLPDRNRIVAEVTAAMKVRVAAVAERTRP